MTILNQITQSHLAVLVMNKDSHNPIARMPIYAEISIVETTPPYVISSEEELLHLKPEIEALVRSRLPLFLDEDTFRSEVKSKLLSRISEIVKDGHNPSMHSEHERQLVDEAITKALAELDLSPSPQPLKQTIHSYPLGFLATDHVGYVSFDLRPFNESSILSAAGSEGFVEEKEYAVYVYPYGKQAEQINVLTQSRLTKEVIFAKLEIPVRHFDTEFRTVSLHSMQNPSLIDWYLSPSSFSVNPSYFIGQDGCENLFPANFATQEFRFFQILRGDELQGGNNTPRIRRGWTLEYLTTWQPLGHTLGSIIYSLPLAPGEIVKIAIIDWARKAKDSRDEDLAVKEQLAHNTKRDRTISETVEAALHEWQRGGSIMGGNSGGAGLSASYGPIGIAAGNAHSFGGGYSTSSGDRNVTAKTVQQASDAFAQHSASFRELRSTIVIQSDQKEYAKAETRVIANHNHSHALTMLYYEVLRHYKVTTEFMRVRNSLLVDYSATKIDFNNDDEVINHRLVLEQVLLDSRLQECFTSFDKLICATTEFNKSRDVWQKEKERVEKLPKPKDSIFHRYEIAIFTGSDGTDGNPYVDLFSSDGQGIHLHQTSPAPEESDTTILGIKDADDFQAGENNIFLCNGSMPISWEKLKKIRLGLKEGSGGSWKVDKVILKGYTSSNQEFILSDSPVNATILDEPDKYAEWNTILPPADPVIPPEPVKDNFIKDDVCCLAKLKKHFVANSQYYKRAIWLLEDPNERASRFEGVEVNGKSLLDWIENRPLDVLGNYVVFPSNMEAGKLPFELEQAKTEKLMTLPTRGVFGEAKLGHCNASEIIDNTRFWDWQTSPIPEQAPDIKAVSTDSRNVTPNLTPTALPNSIVNIVNPSNLPDPTAMASVMNLLGKSDIFRDMSMGKEVNDLLKQLSSDAVKYGELALKARQVLDKQNANTGNSGGGNSQSPTNTTSGNSGGDELSKRVDAVKGMVGIADPNQVKSAMNELAQLSKKPSIFDQNAIASTDPSFVPSPVVSFAGDVKNKGNAIAYLDANFTETGATRYFYLSKPGKTAETIQRAKTLISDPNSLNQGFTGTCGEAAFFNVLIESVPGIFAQFFVNLMKFGSAAIGRLQIKPTPGLLNSDFDKIMMKYPQRTYFADWIILAALRSSENLLLPYDGDPEIFFQGLGQGTPDSELASYFERSDFCVPGSIRFDSYNDTGASIAARKAVIPSDSIKVIFFINTKLIANSSTGTHFIVVKSPFVKNGNATSSFEYFTWGTLVNSAAQGLNYNFSDENLKDILSKVSLKIK